MFSRLNANLRRALRPAGPAHAHRQRGAIAVFAAMIIIVAAGAAGAALDFGRAYFLRERLQQTADAAALGANAFVGDRTSANLVPIAESYFAEHGIAPDFATVTLEKKEFDPSEGTFEVEIKAVMKTAFLGLLGRPNLTVRTKAISLRKPGPAEIAIALDMSVSMAGLHGTSASNSPIGIAKEAIKSFLDMLSAREDPAQLDEEKEMSRVGIAFFNHYANIGTLPADESGVLIDRDGIMAALGTPPSNWIGCVGTNARSDDTLSATQALKFIYNLDRSCGARNQTPPPRLPGMIPIRGVKNVSKSAIETAFNAIYTVNPPTTQDWDAGRVGPFGRSYAAAGIFAAFNLLTPEAPFTTASTPSSLHSRGGSKFLILVADGYNNVVLDSSSINGTIKDIFRDGRDPLRVEAEDIQKKLCDNIEKYGTGAWDGPAEGKGVTIFVIAYNFSNDAASKQALKDCASSDSYFFEPSTAQALKDAFRDIDVLMKPLRLKEGG